MLKLSAVVGGPLLWVTPTVTVLTATPAFSTTPSTLEYGPTVKGREQRPQGRIPNRESEGLARKFAPFRPSSEGLSADVQIYVMDGNLDLDLDGDKRGGHCTLLGWTGHKGQPVLRQHRFQ